MREDALRLMPFAGAFLAVILFAIMANCAQVVDKNGADVALKCIERGGSWVPPNCIGKEAAK